MRSVRVPGGHEGMPQPAGPESQVYALLDFYATDSEKAPWTHEQ